MAVSYNQDTYNKAYKAAERAYEVIPQVNAAYARKNFSNKGKNQAIEELAEQIWPLVKQDYPEDTFNETMAAELSKSREDDWFRRWYLGDRSYSPRARAEQDKFDKMQDLVVDGKWYNMPQKELDLKMAELGFDPTSKESRAKFLDVLSQHQLNYDRGKVVDETMSSPRGIAAAVMDPTATQEAVRQSLTGDFNDSRMNSAVDTDIVASALLGGASRMSNPVVAGITAGGLEAARQFANKAFGNEANWGAPMMAGLVAGTVPAGAQYIGGILSKGGTTGARPLARGFQRGLRGADDPLKAERDNLKNILIAGRDASVRVQDATVGADAPRGFVTDLAGIEGAGAYDRAAKALETLGYGSQIKLNTLDQAVVTAQKKLASSEQRLDQIIRAPRGQIPEASRQAAMEQAGREADLAKSELERAIMARRQYVGGIPSIVGDRRYFPSISIEDVLGLDPRHAGGGAIQIKRPPKKGAIDIVLKEGYDQPVQFSGVTNSGLPDYSTVDDTKGWVNTIRSQFPEKYSAEVGREAGHKRYNAGLALGRFASYLAPVETAFQVTPPEAAAGFKERAERFKNTEWYQNLPKEKKNAVEKALKGE